MMMWLNWEWITIHAIPGTWIVSAKRWILFFENGEIQYFPKMSTGALYDNGSFLLSVSCLGETKRSERWWDEVAASRSGEGHESWVFFGSCTRWGLHRDPCLIIDTVTILPGTKNPTMTFTRAIYFQSSSDSKSGGSEFDLKSENTTC